MKKPDFDRSEFEPLLVKIVEFAQHTEKKVEDLTEEEREEAIIYKTKYKS